MIKKVFICTVLLIALTACQCTPPSVAENAVNKQYALKACKLQVALKKDGTLQSIHIGKSEVTGFSEDFLFFHNGSSLPEQIKTSSPLADETSLIYSHRLGKTRLKVSRTYSILEEEHQIVIRYHLKNRTDKPIQFKWRFKTPATKRTGDNLVQYFTDGKLSLKYDGKLPLNSKYPFFESQLISIPSNNRVSWKVNIVLEKE